jgi:hypothetical protein
MNQKTNRRPKMKLNRYLYILINCCIQK